MTPSMALVPTGQTGLMHSLVDKAERFAAQSKAPATVRAYQHGWKHFRAFCDAHALVSMPALPATVGLYLAAHADVLKPATLSQRLAAVSMAHKAAGFESPCSMRHAAVSEVLAGIRREKGTAQVGKAALLTTDIRSMVAALPAGVRGKRDAALLLLGFAGAFRRSEMAALVVDDLEFCEEGLRVNLRRSKTDQEARGRKVAIPYGSDPVTCPVRAMKRWLEAAQITTGPVFRAVHKGNRMTTDPICDAGVLFIVKRSCTSIGLEVAKFGAHSLRAGFCTQSAIAGASERSIMKTTGHKSVAMVLRYVRDTDLFRDNAAMKLGL
jgi:integrase